MAIEFNSIPNSILVPGAYIEFDNSRAIRGTPAIPSRVLGFAQMFTAPVNGAAAGTAVPGVPVRIFQSSDPVGLFGQGSMAARMVRAMLAANSYTELWVLPLADNPAGAVATGTVTVGGAPTAAGTYQLYIGGDLVQIAVAAGASLASIATALAAAINANNDLAVTAVAAAAVVTLTLKWKGLSGNDLDLRSLYYSSDSIPAGLTATIVPMSGGTANPDLTAAIAAMGGRWYTEIAQPYRDGGNMALVGAELIRRWGPMVQTDGFAFTAVPGSTGTEAAFGLGFNNQLVVLPACRGPSPPWIWSGVEASIHAYYLQLDPARPTKTLVLPGLMAPAEAEHLIWNDRSQLLASGIATHTVDANGNVLIERSITSYRVNAAAITDRSYFDIQTLATLRYFRWSERARVSQLYPRHKLADDTLIPGQGQPIVRPKDLVAMKNVLAAEWADNGFLSNLETFMAGNEVERDANDPNRVNSISTPQCIGQFLVYAGQIAFSL